MSVLPDVLAPGLKVVFCGTAVGTTSARAGAYYAGQGNQFWAVLAKIGLTPMQLAPASYAALLEYDIGLSDLVKQRSGQDVTLDATDFDVAGFREKMSRVRPFAVAFNGKKAAETFLGHSVSYGQQVETIGMTTLFALPSTSGSARGYWDESYWHDLAGFLGPERS